jgi:hypothetical protein
MGYRLDEIRENYRRMTDEELIGLARQKGDLTPEAFTAVLDELANRGISEGALETENDADEPREAADEAGDYLRDAVFSPETQQENPSSDLAAVFSGQSEAEAKNVQDLLKGAGIESQLQLVVLVAGDRSDDALRIISAKLENDPGSPDSGDT